MGHRGFPKLSDFEELISTKGSIFFGWNKHEVKTSNETYSKNAFIIVKRYET